MASQAHTSTSNALGDLNLNSTMYSDIFNHRNLKRNVQRAPTKEERDEEARQRRLRLQKRRASARKTLADLSHRADKPPQTPKEAKAPVHRLTKEELNDVQRRTSWFGNGDGYSFNAALGYLADPTAEYDKWAQAYRMLGAFIDCDHDKSDGSGDNGGGGDGGDACSRWMMWAAYVNPNYQGYEYEEYFSEEPYSKLDCHNPDTEWELIGVYRQEFYQFIEQISKHLWAIDEYEYIVARAGLMYMTDEDCFQVGNDNNGNAIRAGIQPLEGGKFMMALYTDDYCLQPDETVGTYDDFVAQTDVDLGSKDEGDGEADDLYEWWYDAQEYTLTSLNEVYEEYMYCTPCMDYPTYQDGYFIGDYGTDDDDLINQCWKFHSHDSFICEGECIAMGHSQNSINQVIYGDQAFGSKMQASSYTEGSTNRADVLVESSWSRIMANAFLTFSFLLFVATFLAFAVARRSRYRESRSSKSRRLLDEGHHDDDGAGHRSVRSRRSRSRKKKRGTSSSRRSSSARKSQADEEGDGLFRTSDQENGSEREHQRSRSRSHRSKSRSGSKRGRSKSESKKRSSSSVGRKSRTKDSSGGGDPPSRTGKSSSRSNVHDEAF
ncbi:expressed unknown protein [Seminavis robusta]|uniref:Uncharacterized protein n=1 Tax=Seminavis robusta TaxID=568900 RepID=A0A9N8EJ80_9STRA|nr:expressed unknown protein [Seminavis robusta]|eukprot:Sro1043_g234810.1 n/a (605) ;mRNA; r:15344-17242